jgi:hypothetical protein
VVEHLPNKHKALSSNPQYCLKNGAHMERVQIMQEVKVFFECVCVFFKPNRNNYIEIETALDLTKYLAEEDEIIVWHEVLVNLVTRDHVSDVNNYDLYPLLKVISCFVSFKINPLFLFPYSSRHQRDRTSQGKDLFIFIFFAIAEYS